jgi:hypothetical protein
MAGGVVYHWKHGWIPLDHNAALSKAKGDHSAADKMLAEAPHANGIQSRQDVAKAALDLPNLPATHQHEAHVQLQHGAAAHNAQDILPGGNGDPYGVRNMSGLELSNASGITGHQALRHAARVEQDRRARELRKAPRLSPGSSVTFNGQGAKVLNYTQSGHVTIRLADGTVKIVNPNQLLH